MSQYTHQQNQPDAAHLQVASILKQGSFYILMGVAVMIPKVTIVADTWHEKLQNKPVGQEWNLKIITTGSEDQICNDIREHKAVAVLDGSSQTSAGVAAWIIEGANSLNRIQGLMITPGNPEDHSAFQSEVISIYSILIMLQRLLATNPRAMGHIKIACDWCSVLDWLQPKKPVDPFAAHSDMLIESKNKKKMLPCMVMYSHIRGHQDNDTPWYYPGWHG